MTLRSIILLIIIGGGILLLLNMWLYYQPSTVELLLGEWLRFGSPDWLQDFIVYTSDSIYGLSILVFGCVIWLFWRKMYITSALLALSLSLLPLIDPVKTIISRPRPAIDSAALEPLIGTSFPSGHAFVALLLSGVLVLAYSSVNPSNNRKFYILCATMYAVFIGWTRIYLQAHYISDVVGGYIVALCVLFSFGLAYRWLTRRLNRL